MHLAIILDGNGRWARAQGWPRLAGHRAGIDAVRRSVESAPTHGVQTLTLYAFSADNWKRPLDEVSGLMSLLQSRLQNDGAGQSNDNAAILEALKSLTTALSAPQTITTPEGRVFTSQRVLN